MNNHFDIAYLRKYVNGELSPSEMYALEKASHQDEFLMDIILGLEQEKALGESELLDKKDLDSAIYERTHPKKIQKMGYIRWISIAAALVLAFGIGLTWYLNRDVEQETMEESIAAADQAAPMDSPTNVAPIDSLADELFEPEQEIAMLEKKAPQRRASKDAVVEIQRPKLRFPDAPVATEADRMGFGRWRDTSYDFRNEDMIVDNRIAGRVSGVQTDNQIVIRGINSMAKKETITGAVARVGSAQDKKTIVTGLVLDQVSGRPLDHVTVRDVQTNEIAITDSSGQYIMPLSANSQELELISLGYESKRIIASNNKVVQLAPSNHSLDEVVVVGVSGRARKTKSEPLAGWSAFRKYLEDQTGQSLLGKGAVTLVFDVSNAGRPVEIQVKKSSNAVLNQRAIQIISNGPDWSLGNDGKKVEVKVEFR